MKKFLTIVTLILVGGCQTTLKYPEMPSVSPIQNGETVTSISGFPRELYFMARKGGLFDLSQDPYVDYTKDINASIDTEFRASYERFFL